MLGLRGGRIEVQFKNQHSVKVTSGGKVINDGQWHVVSVHDIYVCGLLRGSCLNLKWEVLHVCGLVLW